MNSLQLALFFSTFKTKPELQAAIRSFLTDNSQSMYSAEQKYEVSRGSLARALERVDKYHQFTLEMAKLE
ncbi:MAG: hypothetical protein ACJAYB_000054 [Psychromonas sp.]|jgi:hypothetical protein